MSRGGTVILKFFFMIKVLKIVCLTCCIATLAPLPVSAGDARSTTSSGYDWNPVMEAIIHVESRGDAKAVSGNSCGAMQITPILVRECNNILKKRKSKKRFTMQDRFSVQKSKEMFLLYQSYFNPKNNVEKAIRSWNGGMNYSVKRTQRYYNKVMANLRG